MVMPSDRAPSPRPATELVRRNRRLGLAALGAAAAMVGVSFAAVPLYTLFCQVTGYNGTPRIGGPAEAAAWSQALANAPRQSMSWTSISGALAFSGRVLAACPFEGTRRVVDVSGDGVNNQGPPAEYERDRLVATVRDEMNHPEVGRIGLGDVADERLARAIDILVEADRLPRRPAPEEVFSRAFLPPLGERPTRVAA